MQIILSGEHCVLRFGTTSFSQNDYEQAVAEVTPATARFAGPPELLRSAKQCSFAAFPGTRPSGDPSDTHLLATDSQR
jgi:hypothetical protein